MGTQNETRKLNKTEMELLKYGMNVWVNCERNQIRNAKSKEQQNYMSNTENSGFFRDRP